MASDAEFAWKTAAALNSIGGFHFCHQFNSAQLPIFISIYFDAFRALFVCDFETDFPDFDTWLDLTWIDIDLGLKADQKTAQKEISF